MVVLFVTKLQQVQDGYIYIDNGIPTISNIPFVLPEAEQLFCLPMIILLQDIS